jgi:PIN domain nuclease of toxin-antitoxin system
VKILLDANIVVWLLERPERIRPPVRDALLDPANELFVSTASLLELTAKASSGRLDFDEVSLTKTEQIANWLNVEARHAWRVRSLPHIHSDPFDRIIVAQALEEGLTLVTGDRLLADYGISVLLT